MPAISLLDAVKVVQKDLPNLTDKLLQSFHKSVMEEIKKRNYFEEGKDAKEKTE